MGCRKFHTILISVNEIHFTDIQNRALARLPPRTSVSAWSTALSASPTALPEPAALDSAPRSPDGLLVLARLLPRRSASAWLTVPSASPTALLELAAPDTAPRSPDGLLVPASKLLENDASD